jgi:hypothetical protein
VTHLTAVIYSILGELEDEPEGMMGVVIGALVTDTVDTAVELAVELAVDGDLSIMAEAED